MPLPQNAQQFILTTTDPYWNLAVEDWLFHHCTQLPALILWQNDPCVVIGRAQNPWRECNLDAMAEANIPLVRRQSGGGTVYHDLGNLNFTIISEMATFSKTANLQLIQRALQTLGVTAHLNARNDLYALLPNDSSPRKISGSAFRQTKDRAFHHGTVLINSDLSQLNRYLNPRPLDLTATGVASVRSQVMNTQELNPNLNYPRLCQAISNEFAAAAGCASEPVILDYSLDQTLPELLARHHEYQSWEWRLGKTLPFSWTIPIGDALGTVAPLTLHFEHARVTAVHLDDPLCSDQHRQRWMDALLGTPCSDTGLTMWLNQLLL